MGAALAIHCSSVRRGEVGPDSRGAPSNNGQRRLGKRGGRRESPRARRHQRRGAAPLHAAAQPSIATRDYPAIARRLTTRARDAARGAAGVAGWVAVLRANCSLTPADAASAAGIDTLGRSVRPVASSAVAVAATEDSHRNDDRQAPAHVPPETDGTPANLLPASHADHPAQGTGGGTTPPQRPPSDISLIVPKPAVRCPSSGRRGHSSR
jgi:hypothetical protein